MADNTPVSQPSVAEAPERIWTVGGYEGHFYLNKGNFAKVEYVRATSPDSITPNSFKAFLSEQMRDPEFAAAYKAISAQVDAELTTEKPNEQHASG